MGFLKYNKIPEEGDLDDPVLDFCVLVSKRPHILDIYPDGSNEAVFFEVSGNEQQFICFYLPKGTGDSAVNSWNFHYSRSCAWLSLAEEQIKQKDCSG
jgi:hypothetical protein